jgi:hypothetical protein
MLLFVLHHLGDPLEAEFVKPGSFANSFLPHVFGVPKWFLQITALPKPATVHYSGDKVSGTERFEVKAGPDGSLPVDQAASLMQFIASSAANRPRTSA